MTPKEKATQLIYAFEAFTDRDNELEFANQCAAIAVDELISEYQSMSDTDSIIYIENEIIYVIHKLVYWQEVKQEIEKL